MLSRTGVRASMKIVSEAIIQELLEEQRKKKKEKCEFWVGRWISRRKILGTSDNLLMELRTEDPDYFRKRLIMTTDQFDTLLQTVTPLIQKCDTNMREALSPKIKLEIILKFLATGDNYPTLAEPFRVPECTISNFLVYERCIARQKSNEDNARVTTIFIHVVCKSSGVCESEKTLKKIISIYSDGEYLLPQFSRMLTTMPVSECLFEIRNPFNPEINK
ncbi:hypothetical protein NQ318_008918 [Aromia moschata]|uniref:Uncharacterized protein n=1 Tax=Aromia moschata TaxID=1265417 RepID=A0AAV8ZDI7_9CUCU|nr:hypothetical protein NQ318_008918 [Aromia moschata]